MIIDQKDLKYAFEVHNTLYHRPRISTKLSSRPSSAPALASHQKEEEVLRHTDSLSKKIFRFDRRIRHFGVISAVGKEILSASRPELLELEPEEETKKLFKQIMLMKGILEGLNRYHGKLRGAVVMREKVMLIMFDGVDLVPHLLRSSIFFEFVAYRHDAR